MTNEKPLNLTPSEIKSELEKRWQETSCRHSCHLNHWQEVEGYTDFNPNGPYLVCIAGSKVDFSPRIITKRRYPFHWMRPESRKRKHERAHH